MIRINFCWSSMIGYYPLSECVNLVESEEFGDGDAADE